MGFSKAAPASASRMGRLTNRGGDDAAADGNKARSAFFHKKLDRSERVIRERYIVDREYGGVWGDGSSDEDDDVPMEEKVNGIIKNFYERFGKDKHSRDYPGGGATWTLLVAGEQQIVPQKRHKLVLREVEETEVKKTTNNDVDKEAWILVARGDTKELPGDHLEDLEGTKWYPLAQGGDMYHESRGTNFKKLSCWGGEKEEDERPWDEANMPIQTGEFIHFGHQQGIFPSIRREPHKNWMRIKAGKTEYKAYSIDNVPNDLFDMKQYMHHIMEQSIEDENIANKKKEAAKFKAAAAKHKPRRK